MFDRLKHKLGIIAGGVGLFCIAMAVWPPHEKAAVKSPNQMLPGSPGVWTQWSSSSGGNGHYFALTPTATNWLDAEKLAVSLGGHLATITSPEEQSFINVTFLTRKFEFLPVWIGLIRFRTNAMGGFVGSSSGPVVFTRYSPNAGVSLAVRLRWVLADLGWNMGAPAQDEFKWATGEDFAYSNWKPGEPNNSSPGENCVAMNWEYSDSPPRGTKGDWNDTPADGTSGFGGTTSGPYFGLMELGQPSKPILSPLTWGLAGLIALILAAALARWKRSNHPGNSPSFDKSAR